MIYNRALKDFYSKPKSYEDKLIPFLLGRNAFNYLIKSLEIQTILMPSFICSMVVDIFKNSGVKIIFYDNLDCDLGVPLRPIIESLYEMKGQSNTFFLWHDYLNILGDIPDELYETLENCNITSIIDATHSLPSKQYKSQNVVFGFRKLLNQPFGALLKLKEVKFAPNNEIALIHILKFLVFHKFQTVFFTIFKRFHNNLFNNILKKFSNFGDYFSFDKNDYFISDDFNYTKILSLHSSLDYNKISNKRSKNFLQYFASFPQKIDLNNFDITCPYGFPLQVSNNKKVRSNLWAQGVHSFILWESLHLDALEKSNIDIKYLRQSILILPVNQDLTLEDINNIIQIINAN